MSRHPHADLMIAYANDASLAIEASVDGERWCDVVEPCWATDRHYRIKPAPKKAYVFIYTDSSGKLLVVADFDRHWIEDERSRLTRAGRNVTEVKKVVFE